MYNSTKELTGYLLMPSKRYPHVKITEKSPDKRKPVLIKHKHPVFSRTESTYRDSTGSVLKVVSTMPEETVFSVYSEKFDQKWRCYQIQSGLWCAILKKNPDIGFFYLTGNKKSGMFRKRDLNHVPNKILDVLRTEKRLKCEYLELRRKENREKKAELFGKSTADKD